jgi:NAD(P)-dependent dehydrogenase (short-subunit alcohol dehydrogenase family)
MGLLEGKVAVITGCAGEHGFGRAIAQRFAREGASLALSDVSTRGAHVVEGKKTTWRGLDDLEAELREVGCSVLAQVVDVTSERQVEAAIEATLARFGRVDILVNNAAAPPGRDRISVTELTSEAWDFVLDVNLKGSFMCTRAVANAMIKRKTRGRIINISSTCGKVGYVGMSAYCASKFGLIGFTQATAKDLALHGITVNAICPGLADTDRADYYGAKPDGTFDDALRTEGLSRRAREVPLGRLAMPDDIAELTAFLASEGAAYITGQSINLSGGLIMH